MAELFLYYIWQYQYFNKTEFKTVAGHPISVFSPGYRNPNAGPDFVNARIKIGEMEWIGSVEIHVNASDWLNHQHDNDRAYENVILHVVWKNDKDIQRTDGTFLPAFELKNRIEESLLLKYRKLINSPEEISCAHTLHSVPDITKLSMLDKALATRLENKAIEVLSLLKRNNYSWEETCYQLLARNFGFKVNADPFLQLALLLPYKIILKHSDKLEQIEALLFGMAGFLDNKNVDDDYAKLLLREYHLLSAKYSLDEKKLSVAQWKFLRLRPANFPTIRLAQFAMLLYRIKNIFSRIVEVESYKEMLTLFKVEQSEYWRRHYQFDKKSKEEVSALGQSSVDTILINTVAPLLAAYGKEKDDQAFVDKAVTILQQIPAESNTITKRWSALEWKSKTAFDSKAFIELFNNFCSKRRCLDCNIGVHLMKPPLPST